MYSDCAQLFAKFKQGEADDSMGAKRDYNCDLIPKFVMAKGLLVKILLHTRTTHYLDFAKVGGSYVMAKGTVNKVPATAQEAMSSNLMGMFEKRRMKKLLDYAFTFDRADASTHAGKDMSTQPMQATFDEYSLDVATATFIGHSIALYTTDECAISSLFHPHAPCWCSSTARPLLRRHGVVLRDGLSRLRRAGWWSLIDIFVCTDVDTSPNPRTSLWKR